MPTRLIVIGAALLVALAWFNWQVLGSERHVATGRPVYFELGVVDPRSLIQGDYMALAYRVASTLPASEFPARGQLAVRLDERDVAIAARPLTPDAPLRPGEIAVDYHRSGFALNVGPDSFFFQEGEGNTYARARYAELRVLPDGAVVLVALRDEQLDPLGRPLFP